MPPTTCPAADLLVRRLAQSGVRDVFGYPGGQLTPVYDAIHRLGGVCHYLTRHEQAAAFMADGYARAGGRPGVCLAVCGPGVYNAATPLAAAHTDSVPVLCISGQVPRKGAGLRSGYYHENDQARAAESFTKKTFRVEDPAALVATFDEAWRTLTQGRPGPVLFDVPIDVLRAEVPDVLPSLPPPSQPAAPSSGDVESMAALIASWQRPLVLAGGGSAGASSQLLRLATLLGAPVFHTGNGKGVFPSSHPLHAGLPWVRATSDLSGMAGNFSPLFDQADGLLAVGCRFSQLTTGSWSLKVPASLAHVDVDPEEIGRHHPVSRALVCDAALGLGALCQAFEGRARRPWAEVPPRPPWRLPGMDLVRPLRRALPADGIVCADVNRLAYVLMADLPLEAPGLFLHPAGAVAMGYGLPAALGAKVAHPERKVVAVVGDGGFQMCAMELATAVQEGIGVVVLLVNDSCLTLIKNTQRLRYGERFVAVDLCNPDFGKLSEAFGVAYALAESDDALETALRKAFASEGTSVIEVRPADASRRG